MWSRTPMVKCKIPVVLIVSLADTLGGATVASVIDISPLLGRPPFLPARDVTECPISRLQLQHHRRCRLAVRSLAPNHDTPCHARSQPVRRGHGGVQPLGTSQKNRD